MSCRASSARPTTGRSAQPSPFASSSSSFLCSSSPSGWKNGGPSNDRHRFNPPLSATRDLFCARLRFYLSPHRRAHSLLLQSRGRRRFPPAASHSRLVPSAFRRCPHLGFRSEQSDRRRLQRRAFTDLGFISRPGARPRNLSRQISVPSSRPLAVDSSRHHHRPLPAHVRRFCRCTTQPLHRFSWPRHSSPLRCHHGAFRWPSKNGPRAGRSFARSRRDTLADVLARYPAESQTLFDRRRPADLHALDGRDRRHFLSHRPRQYAASRNLGPPPPRHHARNQRRLHPDLCCFRRLDRHLVSRAYPRPGCGSPRAYRKTLGGRMSRSRRDFIKFVVVGSVTAGCPIDATLLAAPDNKRDGGPLIHGEHFEVCHQIRDGHQFEPPDPTRKAGIVIVGGGVAGLSAAYFLRGKDWLLLEKEDYFGGNAFQEDFAGDAFGTGSAYAARGDFGDQLS